ncbi:hypothetical protein JCM8547_005037 [Rhodosporidiobolus lusitaniae]
MSSASPSTLPAATSSSHSSTPPPRNPASAVTPSLSPSTSQPPTVQRARRGVHFNEHVAAVAAPAPEQEEEGKHVVVPVSLSPQSSGDSGPGGASTSKQQHDRRRGSLAAFFSAAAGGGRRNSSPDTASTAVDDEAPNLSDDDGGKGGGDPFSNRYRVDDVPISLDPSEHNGALEGLVSPFANQLEVWVDPLERDGLPSLARVLVHGGVEDLAEKGEIRNGEGGVKDEESKAQGLVQGTAGGFGLWEGLRKRRDSIRRLRDGEDDKEEEGENDGEAGGGTNEKTAGEPQHQHPEPGMPGGIAPGGPGILAALMALQREEAALAASSHHHNQHSLDTPSASTLPTPSSTAPSSPHLTPSSYDPDLSDDSEEELEREKFIARLRRKRASKNALHAASSSVASKSRSAASAAFRAATGGLSRAQQQQLQGQGQERGRAFTASSRSASTSTLSAVGEERSASRSRSRSRASSPSQHSPSVGLPSPLSRPPSSAGGSPSSGSHSPLDLPPPSSALPSPPLNNAASPRPSCLLSPSHKRSQSSSTLSRLSLHSTSPPTSPVEHTAAGGFVPHRTKLTSELTKRARKLGDRLGLDIETSRTRPAAARSGAGVFGGLVLGTAALAAPATPAGSSLAPLPTRPGYTLSRYSAPDVNAPVRGSRTQPSSPTSPPGRTLSPPPSKSAPGPHGPSPPRSPGARSFESGKRGGGGSRMSLSEMVREEEEKEKEKEGKGAGSATLPLPPPVVSPPGEARRGGGRRAVFSLQLNDLPSPTVEEDDFRDSPPPSSSRSRRPSLTISTSALTTPRPGAAAGPRTSPSPTSATFRFFGPKTPKSPSAATSPRRDYFPPPVSATTAAERAERAAWAAEREKERLERKAREEREREARERERDLKEWVKEKKRRRKVREKELKARRVFITEHVAAILERQEFILKLARAFMMFGAPSHRLEAQIQATARVLELPYCTAMYLPNLMLINFADPATCTSDIKFVKQPSGLDFGKLKTAYYIYNKTIRDKLSVSDASSRLDDLLVSPPKYSLLQNIVLGGLAGAFIMPSAFYGSFIDMLAAIPLGGLLVLTQVFLARNTLYSSLFEIVVCVINSAVAGALSYTDQFCYYSISAGSIVLVLPGYLVFCAALEIANRSIVSGAVRITYAALYALFLGFGLSAGAEIYTMGGREDLAGGGDYTCAYLREDAPWWRATVSPWFYFLTIPGFLFCMAIKHGQPIFRRDTLIMVLIGGAVFATNYWAAFAFTNMPALTSAFGAFVVGVLGNAYSRLTRESATVVMVVGCFVQLPSGLANGGLLSFAQSSTRRNAGANNFSNAVNAAGGLIRVTIGICFGLYTAAALMNLISRRGRRRGANLSTF